jgi:hypothetical protein
VEILRILGYSRAWVGVSEDFPKAGTPRHFSNTSPIFVSFSQIAAGHTDRQKFLQAMVEGALLVRNELSWGYASSHQAEMARHRQNT